MAVPSSVTFRLMGVVPDAAAARKSGEWRLTELSASPKLHHNCLWDDRLLGLQPALRIRWGFLYLKAESPYRASVRSAWVRVGDELLDCWQGGDVITLVGTPSSDNGISVLRGQRLIFAAGAVSVVPLGAEVKAEVGIQIRGERRDFEAMRNADSWLDVSIASRTERLRKNEATTMGTYQVSVVQGAEMGLPGHSEVVAISCREVCSHDAVIKLATWLGPDSPGFWVQKWPKGGKTEDRGH